MQGMLGLMFAPATDARHGSLKCKGSMAAASLRHEISHGAHHGAPCVNGGLDGAHDQAGATSIQACGGCGRAALQSRLAGGW